jgi:adenosylcobinamide kinase/adenosylcobinamide-phosphate guanylyltransferase
MRVALLGTGSADGWPNPFCSCGSCAAAARAGHLRAQTSALVDGPLLLDCGADTPRAAVRAGCSLAGVTHVLLTHAHPDHCDPAFLLYRSWAADAGGGLTVLGPPPVIETCRGWLAPDSPVRLQALAPGERVDCAGYAVRAVPATHLAPGEALLYDVTDPDGARLLYATDTGPLGAEALRAVADAAYDLVLLEETFGDSPAVGGHLDLVSFAATLRELRRVGAVGPSTDVVAVHLSHSNPPLPQLNERLAACGARAVDDATVLPVPSTAGSQPASPAARTLVLGGARSGKSQHAEAALQHQPDVVYVATATPMPADPEWQRRVAEHRARRPASWRTVETSTLEPLLAEPGAPLLIDCLTLWLTTVMDSCEAWADDGWERGAETAVYDRIDALAQAWRATPRTVVAVSNEVGSGVVPDTDSGRRFRDALGRLNTAVADGSDRVLLCVAGRALELDR